MMKIMKEITVQAQNKVNINGKLLDVTTGSGTLSDGRAYERANLTVRVQQSYGGRDEVSEIPVSMFASQFTTRGTPNPAYKSLQDLKTFKTAQDVGFDDADTVRLTGCSLRENAFVSKSGQLINGWQINTSFINKTTMQDTATFVIDIFIMDMHDEVDRDGDSTGRLVIKGGIVQYGGKLDVVEFIVEGPEQVDYIQRNWNINDTVTAKGRVRVTSVEVKDSGKNSSSGEDIPDTTTRFIRELIIVSGDDEGKEEEFAYDPTDIKKAFNVRKANIEQLQMDAKKASSSKPAQTNSSKYSWE
jgi:hypothetical protein